MSNKVATMPDARRNGQSNSLRAGDPVIKSLFNLASNLRSHLSRHVIGQPELVTALICAFLADIKLCLMGPSGEGKTHAAETMARLLGIEENTFPLTTDTTAGEIKGFMRLDLETHKMVYDPGPFTKKMVILDEINRTSFAVQNALLYIFNNFKVVVDGRYSYPLDPGFTTIMTMNPPEDEGTRELIPAFRDRIDTILPVNETSGYVLEEIIGYICSNKEEDAKVVQLLDQNGSVNGSLPTINYSIILEAREAYRAILNEVSRNQQLRQLTRQIIEQFRDRQEWKVRATPRTGASILKMATIRAIVNDGQKPTKEHIWQVAPDCLGLVEPRALTLTTDSGETMLIDTPLRLTIIQNTVQKLRHKLENPINISQTTANSRNKRGR